tara:strand:+ start:326 stop:925 length:600 start_codon:yes stop_codon:yes gene_type:complete
LIDFNKLQSVEVDKTHFPFFSLDNCLLDNQYRTDLARDFPDIKSGGSIPPSAISLKESIKKIISDLESQEMKAILEEKLNVDLSNSEIVTTLRGYSRKKDGKIHTDSKSKIITLLLYLNESWEYETGKLRMLKSKENLDDFIKEIPATLGSVVAFKVTENCFHGFLPFEGKRQSIQMNYVYRKNVKTHKLRHFLSSLFK